jgi:hypothetical protein
MFLLVNGFLVPAFFEMFGDRGPSGPLTSFPPDSKRSREAVRIALPDGPRDWFLLLAKAESCLRREGVENLKPQLLPDVFRHGIFMHHNENGLGPHVAF